MRKFIPIIGSISAGKSTFLKALLGTNVLQTGVTVTTKFVCLIKNSKNMKFYHVIPEKKIGIINRGIEFIKEGHQAFYDHLTFSWHQLQISGHYDAEDHQKGHDAPGDHHVLGNLERSDGKGDLVCQLFIQVQRLHLPGHFSEK